MARDFFRANMLPMIRDKVLYMEEPKTLEEAVAQAKRVEQVQGNLTEEFWKKSQSNKADLALAEVDAVRTELNEIRNNQRSQDDQRPGSEVAPADLKVIAGILTRVGQISPQLAIDFKEAEADLFQTEEMRHVKGEEALNQTEEEAIGDKTAEEGGGEERGVLDSQHEFVGFRRYSNKLDNFIAKEFNKNIFCPEKPIPKKVVDQIMQLIFSYAARILLCLTYYSSVGIGEWQLQTLLSAYKILAEQNNNNDDGIFPFPIIQIGANEVHLFMDQNISKNTSEQKQFIENFNFVLKLSKFSLSYYDVYKVLEAILLESSAVPSSTINNNHLPTNPPPAVHTFLKQYFVAKLGSKLMGQSNVFKVDCAFVHFGRELERRLKEHNSPIRYPGFSQYVKRMEKECGKAPHIKHNYRETPTENTPSRMSKQLEMELFHEPLWNYARAIQIDSHACKAVLQFADALKRIFN
ncbi:hypothetical protein GPALN_014744 [Globodera pallida]|nr:hypothetical protein GPALN_014744 [Globodera pallida]